MHSGVILFSRTHWIDIWCPFNCPNVGQMNRSSTMMKQKVINMDLIGLLMIKVEVDMNNTNIYFYYKLILYV